jgi:hypothetical protein
MRFEIESFMHKESNEFQSYNCWFISTMMIRFKSVYCMSVVYWLNDVRLMKLSTVWSICRDVGHVIHTNSIRSGYLRLVKPLVRHWDHFKKVVKPFHQPGYSVAIALSHSVVYSLFTLCRIVHEYHWLIDSLTVSLVDSLAVPLIDPLPVSLADSLAVWLIVPLIDWLR